MIRLEQSEKFASRRAGEAPGSEVALAAATGSNDAGN